MALRQLDNTAEQSKSKTAVEEKGVEATATLFGSVGDLLLRRPDCDAATAMAAAMVTRALINGPRLMSPESSTLNETVTGGFTTLSQSVTGPCAQTASKLSANSASTTAGPLRPRSGGSTMKTAKVWKYFLQLPTEEQAAECRLCFKRIKATNSSTTGMIRHLRSCHVEEYQMLQAARQSVAPAIKSENAASNKSKSPMAEQKEQLMAAHSIANIMSNDSQRGVIASENIEKTVMSSSQNQNHHKRSRQQRNHQSSVQKKTKFDDSCAVDLTVDKANERLRKIKENFWPDDHPDALRITDQVGLMLLMDNESPAAVDRAGFRNLLRVLQPKYQLPTAEQFQNVVMPKIYARLKQSIVVPQRSMNITNRPFEVSTRLEHLATRLLASRINDANGLDDGISMDLSGDQKLSLSVHIDEFIKQIGEFVFPKEQVIDLLTRCYYAHRHFEKRDNMPLMAVDFTVCVDYVLQNLKQIHSVHAQKPITMFQEITNDEHQFLTDLSLHIHSVFEMDK